MAKLTDGLNYAPAPERNPHPYGSEEFCGWLNARLISSRGDAQWVPDGNGGILLADKPGWTEQHSKDIARRAEAERADWKHRHRYPVQ